MVIPLHDDNPSLTKPLVTVGIIIACALVYVWQHLLLSNAGAQQVAYAFGAGPRGADRARIPAGGDRSSSRPGRRSLTSMFLHGGFWHLAGNMLYLWVFGNNIEDAMGHVRFLLFYLLCGVAAVFAQVLPNPGFGDPDGGRQRRDLRRARRLHAAVSARARVVRAAARLPHRAARTIPGDLGAGGVVRHATRAWAARRRAAPPAIPQGGIAFGAHIGGFIAGLVLVTIFKRRDVPLWRRY